MGEVAQIKNYLPPPGARNPPSTVKKCINIYCFLFIVNTIFYNISTILFQNVF